MVVVPMSIFYTLIDEVILLGGVFFLWTVLSVLCCGLLTAGGSF